MSKRPDDQVLTETEALEVYKLLVEYGGADPSSESPFVGRNTNMRCSEFVALPELGFNGRFWRLEREMVCTCGGAESDELYDRIKELNDKLCHIVHKPTIMSNESVGDCVVTKANKLRVVNPHWFLTTSGEWLEQYACLLERIGRICYKSEDRITDDSADGFIKRIIRSGHESVLEHCSITVKVIGSRAMSHQLVRHRVHSSYSQESQRYCDYGKSDCLTVICPHVCSGGSLLPEGVYARNPNGDWIVCDNPSLKALSEGIICRWLDVVLACYQNYLDDRADGVKPEDARYILPNATKTEVQCTYGLRQWRNVFKQRALNPHAQWEIKGIFQSILKDFANRMPSLFGDLAEQI